MKEHGTVRIGISGWTYPPWRGVFYPKGLAQKHELTYAAKTLNSIEINGTFYSMQRPSSFARWFDETPEDFVFSVKGPRFLTHIKRLKDPEEPLMNLFASGLFALRRKLGPMLWQLPPSFRFEPEIVDHFLGLLPHTTEEAAALARGHSKRMEGRSLTDPGENRPLQHAMEVRHKSFAVPEFVSMLTRHNVALVCADTVAWPRMMDVTSDFVYCRLHGSEEMYASGYTDEALDRWAARIAKWATGSEPEDAEKISSAKPEARKSRDVFVYFDNDLKVRAPFDAQALRQRIEKLFAST
jgi:uncharacterized protein YecE (DUF72 family)